MKIRATSVTFAPSSHEGLQRRIMSAALRAVAEYLGQESPGLEGAVSVPPVTLSMPYPLESVVGGQLSESSAAALVAKQLYEAIRHRVPHVAKQQAERKSWWRKLCDAFKKQEAVASTQPTSASEAASRDAQLEVHARRIQELLSTGAFKGMGFHGSLSDMLAGLEQTGGRIISAADLEKESVAQVSGEGDAFSGKAGKKNFISIGVGEAGLGTAVAYAQAVQQLNHYNVKRYSYDELLEEIRRLQLVVTHFDQLKISVGGPIAGVTTKSKEQFAAQLHKLQLEKQLRDKLPKSHPGRRGGPNNCQNFPVLFEFDLANLNVAERHDVKPGGSLGGEASLYGQADLRQRLVRFYAPAEKLEETRQRLAAIVGHQNFEALAIEALATLPGEGSYTGSSRVTTLALLEKLQENFVQIQKAYAEAVEKQAEVNFEFLLQRVKTFPEGSESMVRAKSEALPRLEADAAPGAPVVHRKPMGIVRPALAPISYAQQVKVVKSGPATKAPRGGPGVFDRFKSLFGGGGKMELIRPAQSPEQQAASQEFVADFLAVEANMRQYGTLSGDDFRRLRDGLGPHLQRNGVAFTQNGNEFTIKPESRGSQLNVMAWAAKKKLGITISYDLRERLKPGAAVGAFNSDAKHLKIDTRSILMARPSGTALHELHHAWLYKRIDRGNDSFLNLKMWNTSRDEGLSSAVMYTGAMSNQELSTFAKQPRQVVGIHLREGNVYSAALDKDLRTYLWKLSQVARQGMEVAERLLAELDGYLASGSSSSVSFDTDRSGDLEVKFRGIDKGLHHRISVHTVAAANKKAGAKSAAGQRALAEDLREKLIVTRDVSEVLLLQAHAITRALDGLVPGQPLTDEEARILKDLTAWPGYALRVAASAEKDLAAKQAELARQRGLAESRLGVDAGGARSLPELEITVAGDDD